MKRDRKAKKAKAKTVQLRKVQPPYDTPLRLADFGLSRKFKVRNTKTFIVSFEDKESRVDRVELSFQ